MTEKSKEYAVALFQLACEENREDGVAGSLKLMSEVFAATPELPAFLRSPAVPKSARVNAVKEAFAGTDERALAWLCILVGNGDAGLFGESVSEYRRLWDERRRVVRVHVTSAVALTETEKQRLVTALEKKYAAETEAVYTVDASLIGGMTVEINGTVLDGSLKRRLQTMKEVMK